MPPTLFAVSDRASPAAGMSAQTTCAPSRARTSGDGGADTAGCAGDDGNLAFERLVPACGRDGIFSTDDDDLAVDEGGLCRKEKAQSRFHAGESGGCRGGDVDQLSGGAALDLLADTAGEAFQSALRDMLVDARRFFRRRAENDDASRRWRGCGSRAGRTRTAARAR